MRRVFDRKWFRNWALPLAGRGDRGRRGAAGAARLAAPAGGEGGRSPARRSLSDKVSVGSLTSRRSRKPTKPDKPTRRPSSTCSPSTTCTATSTPAGQQHLRPVRRRRRVPRQGGQGPAGAVRRRRGDGLRRRQHRRQPARERPLLRGADHDRHEPDERRLRLGRKPRVRQGQAELLRIQNGGCHPVDGCTAAPYALPNGRTTNTYPGADFQYLSANVIVDATGKTLFPAYGDQEAQAATAGKNVDGRLHRRGAEDDADDRHADRRRGPHLRGRGRRGERGRSSSKNARASTPGCSSSTRAASRAAPPALNGCAGNLAGSDIADIAARLDPSIKVIVSAHTHDEYRCTITTNGVTRLITSASSFGRILSDITLTFDDRTGELLEASADELDRQERAQPPGTERDRPAARPVEGRPAVAAVVEPVRHGVGAARQPGDRQDPGRSHPHRHERPRRVDARRRDRRRAARRHAARRARRRAARVHEPRRYPRRPVPHARSSGGEAPGEVTYGEAFTVQPFGNSLVTKTMTGDMIRRLLQQQFQSAACRATAAPSRRDRVLQISSTFKYESNPAARRPAPARSGRCGSTASLVQPSDTLPRDDEQLPRHRRRRVHRLQRGHDALGGAQDIDAFVAYFQAAGGGRDRGSGARPDRREAVSA